MEALQIQDELYVSFSQINTYISCPLKYKFHYVEQREPERISSALPFGRAIHKGIEQYYRKLQETGLPPKVEHVLGAFCVTLLKEIDDFEVPVIYKKQQPDVESLLTMGEAMLMKFYEQAMVDDYEILGVELPLSAPLYDENRELMDIRLFGIIDLLLKDGSGNLLVVDNKTSKTAKSPQAVQDDLQLTAYSYLLCCSKYSFPRAPVNCSFQVLRKLKKPTVEHYHTIRTAEQRKRFARLTSSVLNAIEARIFHPVSGWMCADCQYRNACANW